ncbi:hypothetical protein DRJ54_07030 [Candidatus Acetothermia bacterium]|nr:MAG: hypothetical protein DRJ54_07030 [Candidatus Acetothermia bacterium]
MPSFSGVKSGAMALWLKRAGRWQRAHALPSYLPPEYLRLSPSASGPAWRASGPLGRYGADSLPEFLEGLLLACRRPSGGADRGLWLVTATGGLEPAAGIPPFDPRELWRPGLELAQLRRPRDKWLLTLHVARPGGALLAVRRERYLASWRTALEGLLTACRT